MWGVEGSEGVEEVCGGGRKCGGMLWPEGERGVDGWRRLLLAIKFINLKRFKRT